MFVEHLHIIEVNKAYAGDFPGREEEIVFLIQDKVLKKKQKIETQVMNS